MKWVIRVTTKREIKKRKRGGRNGRRKNFCIYKKKGIETSEEWEDVEVRGTTKRDMKNRVKHGKKKGRREKQMKIKE